MKKTIDIVIKDKIARPLDPKSVIVCGNSDYVLNFHFDEEWAEYEEKTAFFICNGVTLPPVIFQGNQCDVPILSNTQAVSIGVSAGNLHTTTSAVITCKKSVRCGSGEPQPPTPDVYAQLMQMIYDGKIKGETGEKGEKGDKGDAGSIKFIPVATLPTENIDESAIYLLPIEGEDEQNRFTEYVYIDGKWETIGAITVQVDHSEYLKKTDIGNGLYMNSQGKVIVSKAEKNMIDSKSSAYNPIVPATQDYAWKMSAIGNKEEWTDEEKAKARELLGAVGSEDYATSQKAGVVKTYGPSGTATLADGRIAIIGATEAEIEEKKTYRNPIMPTTLDKAVKVGVTTNTETLTDEEKASACEWIGALAKPASTPNNIDILLYSKDGVSTRQLSLSPIQGSVPSYGGATNSGDTDYNGYLSTSTPVKPYHAATKKYVDDLIAELRAEIAALKGE